jgi:lactoylglutathione lyase
LPDAPTCFRGLTVPGSGETITDPDGLAVHRDGADRGIAVAWATRDVGRLHAMLVDGFGAHAESDTSVRLGTTRLDLVDDPDAGPVGHVAARGFRYLTVQVFDVLAAHEHLLASGWQEGIAPRRLGDVAMISFVRDPEGSWIEVSQRASVTGPLPG